VLGVTLILALIIGVIAYDFMTFSLPPGETISAVEDVPTAGEIFHQSFFVNATKGFIDSPFVFMLLILTWILGGLLFLSELAKEGFLGSFVTSGRSDLRRLRIGAYILVAMSILNVAIAVFGAIGSTTVQGPGFIVRFALQMVMAGVWLWVAVRIVRDPLAGQPAAGAVAAVSLIVTAPLLLVPGAGISALLAVVAMSAVLILVWDSNWSELLLPVMTMAFVSLGFGLGYAFLHGNSIRTGILPPMGVTDSTAATVRRVLEADQTAGILTVFYVFLFLMLLVTGLALAWEKMSKVSLSTTVAGLISLGVLLVLAFVVVAQTNLQVIQADIVYKRADPWDKQAARAGDPALWDNAIAIYEHAIDLAPREDFYYLWLGRAYLERSSVTEDPAEQEALLRTAEERLKEAQQINPLNTDHTANLARLNTRWAEIADGEERQQRISIASDYYNAAMSLSPNNAVIINEYARLAYVLGQDCDRAIDLFERSTERDPFYAETLFERYEVLRVCGEQQEDDAERMQYLELAAESLAEGLERQDRSTQDWLQLAGLYIALDRIDDALEAYDAAVELADADELEPWRIDYTMADLFFKEGVFGRAEEFATLALDRAPTDVTAQIEQFIEEIAAARGEVDG
jgi:tetratricopeptide (TPR) repeat protein